MKTTTKTPKTTKPQETYPPNVALEKFKHNKRVRDVRLMVSADCCPVCAAYEGTYEKFEAPSLPIEGCSHPKGCRCFYEPMLTEIYP